MTRLLDTFDRQPLRLKLLIGTISALLVAGAIGGYSLWVQAQLAAEIQSLYQYQLQGVAHTKDAQLAFSNVGRAARYLVLDAGPQAQAQATRHLADVEAQLQRELAAARASIAPGSSSQMNLQGFDPAYKIYRANIDHYFALALEDEREDRLNDKDGKASAYLTSKEFTRARDAVNDVLAAMATAKLDSALAAARASQRLSERSFVVTLLLLLGGISLKAGITYFVSRSIRLPLNQLRDTVEQLAHGKLALTVPHTGMPNEVGDLARSIAALREEALQMADQRWLKTRLASLSSALQAAPDTLTMSSGFLSFLAGTGDITEAGIWLLGEAATLEFSGGWPGSVPAVPAAIAQRCASSGAAVEHQADSGLMLALPALLNGRVLAVATFHLSAEPHPALRALLDEAMPLLAVGLGIHERSERIRLTEAWFRGIIESAPDGMVVINDKGIIVLVNPRLEMMFGYAVGELMGQSIDVLVPLPVRGRHPGLRHAYAADGATRQMGRNMSNLMGVRKDGSEFAIDVGLSRLPDLQGDGYCICAAVRDVTERKRLEQEMSHVNFLADIALELTDCGYWHIDYSDPDHYYQSDRAAAILGEPRKPDGRYHLQDEWMARLVQADPAIAAQTGERYQGALDGKYPSYVATYAYRRPLDGRIVWVRAGGKIVRDDNGKALYMYGAYQDITALKESEQAIINSQRQIRTLVDSVGSVITMKDRQGRYQLLNGTYEKLLGISEKEILGMDAHAFMPKDVADKIAEVEEQVMATGLAITYEETIPRVDGSAARHFVTTKTPLINERGEIYGICGIATDITERQQVEKALRNANAEQTAMFEAATLGIAFIKDRVIVRSNRQLDAMFGTEPGTHLGQSTRSWYASEQDFQAMDSVYHKMATGKTHQREKELVRRDGSRFWCRVSGSAIDPSNIGSGTVWMLEDVSEARASSEAIERAREIAEDATKVKSEFLANMSHEIRTPMNAIIGMSYLALQTDLDKRQRNYISKVHRSAENLLGIINDILDFSKIEAGKMSMERIDFHLDDVLENFTAMVGMKAEEKGLELLFNLAPDLPTALVGDPLRLGQVLINLGSNAMKFTDSGEVVVGVETIRLAGEHIELHFWVRDSGIGMTPGQLDRLFRSFTQADTSTTRKYGGTGLGLVISKHLVDLMDGRIWVESTEGKGTTFHFHASFGLQKNPLPRRMFLADELNGIRVLVVDDNDAAREILSAMARSFGLQADVAASGQQALSLVNDAMRRGLPYDLLLLDWRMPGMDGLETMRELEQRHPACSHPVIMVTAFGREDAMSTAESSGVRPHAILTKPVTSSTLLEAIGVALGKALIVETRVHEKAHRNETALEKLVGARILLVEDNRLNQELALELLEKAGVLVQLAENGQQALDALAQDPQFDLVLMDCQMPVMDGYEATRAIRSQPAWHELPVLAMTANAMAGDREKALMAGMQDHIPKPLRVAEMYTTIAKWLKRSGSAAAAAAATPATAAVVTPADMLPDLPGIDTKAGLQTAAMDARLYRKLLKMFVEDHSGFREQFDQACATSQPDDAMRLAHTLKGTSGNIGAFGVQAAAQQLESLCLQNAAPQAIAAAAARTVACLDLILPGIRALATASVAPAMPGRPVDPDWHSKLNQLRMLLQTNDTAAMDLAEELASSAADMAAAAVLKKITAALDRFDFDAALHQLDGSTW